MKNIFTRTSRSGHFPRCIVSRVTYANENERRFTDGRPRWIGRKADFEERRLPSSPIDPKIPYRFSRWCYTKFCNIRENSRRLELKTNRSSLRKRFISVPSPSLFRINIELSTLAQARRGGIYFFISFYTFCFPFLLFFSFTLFLLLFDVFRK